MVTIKNGTIEDFFDSALHTVREIDDSEKVTKKHTIWMETNDLLKILKPQRTKLIKYLRDKTKVYYSVILDGNPPKNPLFPKVENSSKI